MRDILEFFLNFHFIPDFLEMFLKVCNILDVNYSEAL